MTEMCKSGGKPSEVKADGKKWRGNKTTAPLMRHIAITGVRRKSALVEERRMDGLFDSCEANSKKQEPHVIFGEAQP
ncbi:hypothetical protein RB195_008968 [Necator americanus]|uniref:Uncharacterized protein n=1 Tax=Necator americanus TaxID=51031 RepID=A0ABR1CUJ4_NECAM